MCDVRKIIPWSTELSDLTHKPIEENDKNAGGKVVVVQWQNWHIIPR